MEILPMWAFYALLLIVVFALVYKLHQTIKDEKSPIEWWHFIATKGKDGEHYADITKLGQVMGIILVIWLAVAMSTRVKELDWMGFCAILTLVLAYLGGVQAFQAYLKSKQQEPKE